MDNPNPIIYTKNKNSSSSGTSNEKDLCFNDSLREEVDALEIFDLIKTINDPEHPVTLEELNVVRPEHIYILKSKTDQQPSSLLVHFTPTIPHCSMATLIGLSIQLKLIRSLPASKYRLIVQIRPGTHNSEEAINKQLADKERVAAAGESANLKRVVAACLMGPPRSGIAL